MWQKVPFRRPHTDESLTELLNETVACKDSLKQLVSLARIIVCAQQLESSVNHLCAVMNIRYRIGEILKEGQVDSLLELLQQPHPEKDREAFKELLGAIQVDARACKDREVSSRMMKVIHKLQAELHQNEATDRDGSNDVKRLPKEPPGQSAFEHQLRRAKMKMRSFDRTLCDTALLAASQLAQQEKDPLPQIKKLFLVARTAHECQRAEMALEFGILAAAICKKQVGNRTALLPSLDTPAFQAPLRHNLRDSTPRLQPGPTPLPEYIEGLRLLIVQFLAELDPENPENGNGG